MALLSEPVPAALVFVTGKVPARLLARARASNNPKATGLRPSPERPSAQPRRIFIKKSLFINRSALTGFSGKDFQKFHLYLPVDREPSPGVHRIPAWNSKSG